MDVLLDWIRDVLGLQTEPISITQMILRTIVIYIAALIFVRLGEKRFLGKNTAFDVILGIMFGSVASRAINSNDEFIPLIAASGILVLLHWLFAVIAYHSEWFANVVKGYSRVLIRDGEIQRDQLRQTHISREDLIAGLRRQVNNDQIAQVHEARLERNGEISVIPRSSSPQVLEVRVEQGVQVIRIQIE